MFIPLNSTTSPPESLESIDVSLTLSLSCFISVAPQRNIIIIPFIKYHIYNMCSPRGDEFSLIPLHRDRGGHCVRGWVRRTNEDRRP